MDRVYLLVFRVFKFFVGVLPQTALNPLLWVVAKVALMVNAKHKKIILANLDFAFGDELSGKQKKHILWKNYLNLVMYGADFIRNQGITKDEVLKKVEFNNAHVIEQAKKEGKAIILQTAHYGNWELLSLAVAARFGAMSVVGRPLDSQAMDDILSANREQFDVELISKYGAMRPMIKALKDGRMLGLLVDQAVGSDSGVEVEFFGKKIFHTHSISVIAKKLNAVVVPLFITTTDYKNFTIDIYESLDVEQSVEELTQTQANIEEMAIRKKPDEWFWFHKKFKINHNYIYG